MHCRSLASLYTVLLGLVIAGSLGSQAAEPQLESYARKFAELDKRFQWAQFGAFERFFTQFSLQDAKRTGAQYSSGSKGQELYKQIITREDLSEQLSTKEAASMVRDAIVFVAGDGDDEKSLADSRGQSSMTDGQANGLLDRYFVEPCDNYVKQFGPGLFAELDDGQSQHNDSSGRQQLDSPKLLAFYYGWAYYKFCNQLIGESRQTITDEFVWLVAN